LGNAHIDDGAILFGRTAIDCRDAEVTRHIANRSIGQVRMRRTQGTIGEAATGRKNR